MTSLALSIYPHLPVALQHVACSYYGWRESKNRFGPNFERLIESLEQSDRWSAAEIANYQDEKLREMVRHAYEHVPFYRSRMKQAKVDPHDIRSRGDLPKLPILTKEEVLAAGRAMVADNARREALVVRKTSGTSGAALEFYMSHSGFVFHNAIQWRHRRRFGIPLRAWHVTFTGKLVVPPEQRRPPFWRWNLPWHQVVMNMQHMTPEKIGAVVDFLNSHDFYFYSGYPSIVHAMAYQALEAGLKLKRPPRVIDMGAENMLDFQRRDIQALTGSMLTGLWGLSEGCANAGQCLEHVYHEDFELGIIERVEERTTSRGVEARMVCTGLAHPEFPFIRYDVGDVGLWDSPGAACACGRQSEVLLGVEGRADNFVVTPEGRRIMRFDYCLKDVTEVKECQIVQDRLGEIRVRIVRRPGYTIRDERAIAESISRYISPRLELRFEYVAEIERTSRYKFRSVVSNLPPRQTAVTPPAGSRQDTAH